MMQEVMDEIENTARAVTEQVHTALPGKIVTFDFNTGTATVKPCGKFETSDGKLLDYPQITDAPVSYPYCETEQIGIVYPLSKGDSCIIIISEIELDEWRSNAESEGTLKFDLTSGMIVPGLMHSGGKMLLTAVNEHAVVIGAAETILMVKSDSVKISVGNTTLDATEYGIAICGDLKVTGNIISTETVKGGKIDLNNHTHMSTSPGTSTGRPE